MQLMDRAEAGHRRPWWALWIVAGLSLVLHLALCQFFHREFGPLSLDIDPGNLWRFAYHFPPRGSFEVLNWLGTPQLPLPLNPFSLAANLPTRLFFTAYLPVVATASLLAMTLLLREVGLTRWPALFGGVVYAWQGDLIPFVFPGHYAYLTTWPFYAWGAWAALRSGRRERLCYPLISGLSCGVMVQMQPDRAGMASLFIALLFLAPALRRSGRFGMARALPRLALCVAVAVVIALASLLALNQTNIQGVKLGGLSDRNKAFGFSTQFSLSPEETLTYLAPGFFGWRINHPTDPYWGEIGRWPDWPKEGPRNLNLAISTTGTVPSALALLGAVLAIWPGLLPAGRRRFLFRLFLGVGLAGLVLSWGYHTPLYRLLFALPLMDKWRNPLKWLEWFNFALPALSALGLEAVLRRLAGRKGESAMARVAEHGFDWLWKGLGALLLLGLADLWLDPYPLERLLEVQGDLAKTADQEIFGAQSALIVALLQLAGSWLVVRVAQRPERWRALSWENPWLGRLWQSLLQARYLAVTVCAALIALTALQLSWVDRQFILPVKLSALLADDPLTARLREEGNRVRVSADANDSVLNSLMQNQFYADRISCLEISAVSRLPDELQNFFSALRRNHPRLWFLAGVKNVVIARSELDEFRRDPAVAAQIDHIDGYTLGPTEDSDLPTHALITLHDCLAKATFVPQAEIIPDPTQLRRRLADPTWDPRRSLLLASAPAAAAPIVAPAGSPAGEEPSVDLRTYDSRRIELSVQTATPGYILINDQFDPDWKVERNGQPAPLLRADRLLRAVAVPAGSSKVTLRYVAHYRLGPLVVSALVLNLISDAALILTLVVISISRLGRSKSRPDQARPAPRRAGGLPSTRQTGNIPAGLARDRSRLHE